MLLMMLKVDLTQWTQSCVVGGKGDSKPCRVIYHFQSVTLCVQGVGGVVLRGSLKCVSRVSLCGVQPENIVLARDDSSTIKLVDFGAARDLSMEKKGSALTLVGTPEFVGECVHVCACIRIRVCVYVCTCVHACVCGGSACGVHVSVRRDWSACVYALGTCMGRSWVVQVTWCECASVVWCT